MHRHCDYYYYYYCYYRITSGICGDGSGGVARPTPQTDRKIGLQNVVGSGGGSAV